MIRFIQTIGLILVLLLPLGAQGAGRLPLKAYGIEQGLMSEVVWCLEEDAQGVLWAGTDVGLHRFDGQRFHLYEGPLPSQKISVLKALDGGGMLVGTLGGMALIQGARCEVLGRARGLPLAPIVDLAQEKSGAWWVLTQDGLFREQAAFRFAPAPGWPEGIHPTALWPARDGEDLRVAQSRALGTWVPASSSWTWTPVEGLDPGESILGLAVDGSGQSWLRTGIGLLRRPSGSAAWRRMAPGEGRDTRSALGFRVDRTGWLWVDTPQGLVRVRGEEREVPPWTLPQASGAMVDREGSLWIWSARGIHRVLGHGLLRTYGIDEGLPSPLVFQALRDGRGRLWLGTRGGLCLAKENGWRMVRAGGVLWLARGPDGALWFAGVPGGRVGRVDPQTLAIQEFAVASQTPSPNARGIAVDGKGRVWLADITQGLAIGTPLPGGGMRWDRLAGNGAPHGSITSLYCDARGRMIVLHGERVSIHEGGTWYELPDVLPATPYQALPLPEGDLLISYRRSPLLTRHRPVPGGWQRLGLLDPFRETPQIMVYSMGADLQGRLWLGTNRGLVKHDLKTGEVVFMGPLEGLPSADCVTRAILVEPGPEIWLGTVAGLVHYRGVAEPNVGAPPAPVLLEVREGTQGRSLTLEQLELPRGTSGVSFHFVVPSYVHPTRLSYQVRLQGVDDGWRNLQEPVAHYGTLPGGKHRLEIRGLRGKDLVGLTRVYPFLVTLAWHETWVGRALLFMGACTVLGLLYLWRVRALRHRNAALERLVVERTRELGEAKTAAERASAFKSLFLASTTHDLRTPLHAILGFSRLATEGPLGPETLRHVRQIHGAAGSMLQLVNNLLDLGKIEAGQLDLHPQPFDLRILVREVADLLMERAREKGLVLEVSMAESLPPCLVGDPLRLRQILINLLGNAIKFTVRGRVDLRVLQVDGQVRLEVEDTGPGIAPDQLPRLFKPYAQGGVADQQGTGLGLSITQQLSHLMGGEVGAESVQGKGSLFWCTFPLEVAEGPCPTLEEAGIEPHERLVGRVLVADDNPANRILAKSCLTQLGVEVELVEDGLQALEALDGGRFDAVILDGHMPRLSGAETLQAIRRRTEGASLPVLLFTASVGEEVEYSEQPFDGTLFKPADLHDFYRILSRFLAVPEGVGASAHLDLERVRQLREVLGDQEALLEFASAFREDARGRLVLMREAMAADAFGPLAGLAHDLKTNAGNLGLSFLSRAAMVLEQEARTGDRLSLNRLFIRMEEAVAEAFRLLDEGWLDRA